MPCYLAITKSPPVADVPPPYVSTPPRISVPLPALTDPPLPLSDPLMPKLPPPATVAEPLDWSVTGPVIWLPVPLAEIVAVPVLLLRVKGPLPASVLSPLRLTAVVLNGLSRLSVPPEAVMGPVSRVPRPVWVTEPLPASEPRLTVAPAGTQKVALPQVSRSRNDAALWAGAAGNAERAVAGRQACETRTVGAGRQVDSRVAAQDDVVGEGRVGHAQRLERAGGSTERAAAQGAGAAMSKPWLTVVPPPKLLEALSRATPEPDLVMPPLPLMTPLKVLCPPAAAVRVRSAPLAMPIAPVKVDVPAVW